MNEMKALIINYPVLKIGGIEQFIYELCKFSLQNKYKVIWVYKNPLTIDDGYNDILDDIILCERKSFFKTFSLKKLADEVDKITCISFTPFDHQRMLELCNNHSINNINPIYIIANTKGRYYYIEEYYYGFIRKVLREKVRDVMLEWYENNQIRFFAELQAKSFESKYNIKLYDINSLIIPSIRHFNQINLNDLKEKYKSNDFNIVTISRFDFPHKNYLLGLIDSFKEIKYKYSNAYLHIVGYGQDENIVRDKINKLPDFVKKSIVLHGALSNERLIEVLKKMHLNISVAGSVAVGAVNGVLSIPARNFCGEECEVYGYLPNSISKVVSTEPGYPVTPYIEDVINFSFEKYRQIVMEGFNAYNKRKVNPDYLFDINNIIINRDRHYRLLKLMDIFKDISYKIAITIGINK